MIARWLVCVAALFIPATLLAQWPAHKSASAPRTADGRVDLLAPPPRTADRKPSRKRDGPTKRPT